MFTLIDGACREDKTMPVLVPPFDLQIRGTVCYKRWRTSIEMEDFNIKPKESNVAAEGDPEAQALETKTSDVFLKECLLIHPVLCESAPPHPLVRDRDKYYYEILKEGSGEASLSEKTPK